MGHVALFSSVSSLLGGGGQANYVAANAAMDAWAAGAQATGWAAQSVQWGAWAGGGMAAQNGVEAHMERLGVGVLAPAEGLAALETLLRQRVTSPAASRIPAVVEIVKKLINNKEPNVTVNPDEVVALGAAVQAGKWRPRQNT